MYKRQQQLFEWMQNTTAHPLVASCVFHYEFEFIHPFADGNGRTGRLWQTLILRKWEPIFTYLPIESMILEHQADYYAALNAANTQGSATVFIEFMLEICLLYTSFLDQQTNQHTPFFEHSPYISFVLQG